jgi:transposase
VPSERSTGEARRQGAITKSGSSLARWLLIEAAWHYRHTPRVGTKLVRRQHGQEAAVIALSWKTQQRLYQLWRRLDHKRGKRRQLVAVAIARHLAGFCWAIVNLDPAPTDTTPIIDTTPIPATV